MVFQFGLGIYGIFEVVRIQREGSTYLCGNAIPVFWTLCSLHVIQHCCNVGKFHKGALVLPWNCLGSLCEIHDSKAFSIIREAQIPKRGWKVSSGSLSFHNSRERLRCKFRKGICEKMHSLINVFEIEKALAVTVALLEFGPYGCKLYSSAMSKLHRGTGALMPTRFPALRVH